MNNPHIVIFDGVCNFCCAVVNFIIERDPSGRFAFAPAQSPVGQALMKKHGVPMVEADTVLLIKDGQCFDRTDAALEITKDLTGFWHWLRILRLLPKPFRDYFYRLFARNRYKLFGKRDTCMVPSASVRERFLD